jgi:molecular chaperone HscB
MNHFELFGLPVSFHVNSQVLRAAFMDIQRSTHPDKFAQSNAYEQEEALEKSAQANNALSTLNNPDKILPYVLEIAGYLSKDEKYELDPAFLMEMMELNEGWMDADSPEEKQAIIEQINALKNEISAPIKADLEVDTILSIPPEKMLQIKDYYYKKKYLDRILAEFHH